MIVASKTLLIGSVGTLLLGATATVWATSACKVPNPNTKLCAAVPPGTSVTCRGTEGPEGCNSVQTANINNFPDGNVDSQSGTTAEDLADCMRTAQCYWDDDEEECVAVNPGPWTAAAKTVVGSQQCPTSEGA